MQVVLDTSDEVVIQILIGWRSPWILCLHDIYQILSDLINFIPGKQIGHLRLITYNNNNNFIKTKYNS